MAKVRGFVYFEDKSLMEVREALWNFDVPGLRYKLFEGVSWPRDKSNAPGIFIDGEVDSKSKNYSREVIFMLRQKVGLEKKIINCDVSSSVGKEDCISHLQGGDLKGKYIGIRILPPYPDTEEIKYAAYDLGGITGANDILLRGVEPITYKNRKLDKKCIDLIGKINFDSKKRRIGNYLKSKNLALEGYSLIELL